jgi:hypothetical protein
LERGNGLFDNVAKDKRSAKLVTKGFGLGVLVAHEHGKKSFLRKCT